ncbi:MAG: MFS transporter, partial [Candidatus Hodarchaeota archaeon]
DKFGRRPLTLFTAIGFITFAVLTSVSPPGPNGLIYFLIFRLLANFFLSGDIVVIIIAEEAPDHLRGRLVGLVLSMTAFGGIACGVIQMLGIRAPIPGPWGPYMSNWQSLYFMNIIGFILIIPLFFFLKETKRFKAMKKYEEWRKKRGLQQKTGWFVPLQKKFARPMILGCVAGFLLQLVYFGQITFFGLYFARELKMNQELIGLLTMPIAGSAGLGAVCAGPLLDRYGRLPIIRLFSYLLIAGATLYAFPAIFIIGEPSPVIQALSVIGGSVGVFSMVLVSTGALLIPLEMLPTHIRSTAMGWISAVNRGAVILVPFFLMFGAEKVGGLGLSYQFMFMLMILAILTSVFTIFLLSPESKGRELEEIVVTEVYTKMEKTRDEKYKEKYYLYLIAFASFIGIGYLYGQTTDGTLFGLSLMLGLYGAISLVCFVVVVYVREKVM